MRRLVALFLAVLFPVTVLASCRGRETAPKELLVEVLSAVGEATPAGTVFSSAGSPYEEGRPLDESLVLSLYSRDDGFCEYRGRVEEAAVFLSSGDGLPYLEVGVFLSYGSADTRPIVEMCLRRARLVSSLGLLDAREAIVVTLGRTVLLCLSSDPAVRARVQERYGK